MGQVFNGFFTTRARMGRASFVDLAQVELLRGPQGPVIGKNTSLGAINITRQSSHLVAGVQRRGRLQLRRQRRLGIAGDGIRPARRRLARAGRGQPQGTGRLD